MKTELEIRRDLIDTALILSNAGDDKESGPILLKDKNSEKEIVLGVSAPGFGAIVVELKGVVPSPPQAHDLVKNIITGLGASVVEAELIVSNSGGEKEWSAFLRLKIGDGESSFARKAGDAIAVALRCGAPIVMEAEAFEGLAADPKAKKAVTVLYNLAKKIKVAEEEEEERVGRLFAAMPLQPGQSGLVN